MSATAKPVSKNNHRVLGSRAVLLPGLFLCMALLVICLLWSITLGAADIAPRTVFEAIFAPNGSFQHLIIQTVRLPRVLSGVIVGASLAVAGAIMQGLTRNPLADSGILGINSGAAFAVVLAVFTPVIGVNGCPVRSVVIPFSCQFPATAFNNGFEMLIRCPRPNGRS